jgi:glycosyltransferase involved in cell wall biosynthesis
LAATRLYGVFELVKKVVFFAPDLAGGGAERAMVEFMRHIDRSRYQPILILCRTGGQYEHLVPEDVPVHGLGKQSLLDFPKLVMRFRSLVRRIQPDLVMSIHWYSDLIQLLTKSNKTISVCSVHSVAAETAKSRHGGLKMALLNFVYPRADAILVLSEANKAAFRGGFSRAKNCRLEIQPNPFDLDALRALAGEPLAGPLPAVHELVAVGRLDGVKGFDRLLAAVAAIRLESDWRLRIVGEGPLRQSLESQAKQLGIAARVRFEGFVENPYPYIKGADVLIMSSHYEAYPNVLIEALALSTAVVAFDCPEGPREILGRGAGILVPDGDSESLTAAIERLLTDDFARQQLEEAGPATVSGMDSGPVTRRLENIFDTLT